MGKIGYNIEEAARAAGASEQGVVMAITDRELPAYKLEGECIILAADIEAWIRTKPAYLSLDI